MRVFVTGATGFIGSQLVRRLRREGHQLRCLARPSSHADELARLGAELVRGDVGAGGDGARAALESELRGCDWAVNLAGVYSFWEPDPSVYRRVNAAGARTVLAAALAAGVAKVVHVSTAAVYGRPADCPFTELSQVGPTRFSEYARSKHAGELAGWELRERGLPLVLVHPGVVTGPGDRGPLGQYVRDFVGRRLPATVFPDAVLTYVHVRDVAEGIVRALAKPGNVGERYLLGQDRLSTLELNRLLAELSGVPPPRLGLPRGLALAGGALLTRLADVTKRPPPRGMAVDGMRTLAVGYQFDGSKAARELGLTYTPIRVAFAELLASLRA